MTSCDRRCGKTRALLPRGRCAFLVLFLVMLSHGVSAAVPAPPADGSVRLSRDPDRTYRSLPLAVDAAQDGDVIELGAGTFSGPITIAGKSIAIRATGSGPTEITAAGTVIQVAASGRAHVVGVTITSREGTDFAPAVLAVGDGFRLEESTVRGAKGFGVEIRNAVRDVELYGNTIRGNGGGGVRFTDALGRLHSNVIADNGGPGLLVDGDLPEGGLVLVEHNTIVRNGSTGGGPITATGPGGPDAPLPETLAHRVTFKWNVASGRLPEMLLTQESFERLQKDNVLIWPDKVSGFFEDVEDGDYRPEDELATDQAGLEYGARLSDDAADRLGPAVDAALGQGRLADALAFARRAPTAQRSALWERIRAALYARYARYIEAQQPGLAVRDFFLALPGAPDGWNVQDRFGQALERIEQAHGQAVDWNALFRAAPAMHATVVRLLANDRVRPGRPTGTGSAWSVAGEATKDLLLDRHSEPIERTLALDNPEYGDVEQTLTIERSRRQRFDDQRRRVAGDIEAYEARHGSDARSSFLGAKRRELDRRSQAVVDTDQRIRELEKTLEQVPKTYTVPVRGQLERTEAMAEVTLRLTDPVGRATEEVISFRREESFLSLEPIPLLGFEGIAPRPVADDRERARYAEEVVELSMVAALGAIEKRDLDRIGALAAAARGGHATPDDWNELFSLLVVYADRFQTAVAAERPAHELRAARDRYPEIDQPRFRLEYDPALKRKPPLRFVAETSAARRQAERLLSDLERRHAAYWAVLPDVRGVFDRIGGRPFEDFLRIVTSIEAG